MFWEVFQAHCDIKTPNLLMPGVGGGGGPRLMGGPCNQWVHLLAFSSLLPHLLVLALLHPSDSGRDSDSPPSDVFVLGRCLFLGVSQADRCECAF